MKNNTGGFYRFLKFTARKIGARELYFTSIVAQEDFFIEPDFLKNQFFYTAECARKIVSLFYCYNKVCCLCTPRLAFEWQRKGKNVCLLDIDERFSNIAGYRPYDILRPEKLSATFDLIIAEPPFNISAESFRAAIEAVASASPRATLALFYLKQNEHSLLDSFNQWQLRRVKLDMLRWNNTKDKYSDIVGFYTNHSIN